MAKSAAMALVDTSDDVEFALDRDVLVIGRDLECDIVIDDRKASRQHCRITRKGDYYSIEDLESRHGTAVNGKPLTQSWVLQLGDEVTVGGRKFLVSKQETAVGALLSKMLQKLGVH